MRYQLLLMDTKNHLSRHFLGMQPSVLRSIPFAPAGPTDDDGTALKHSLLALADWNQDSEVTCSDALAKPINGDLLFFEVLRCCRSELLIATKAAP